MEFHSALAESHDLEEACDAVVSDIRRALGPKTIDLMVAFVSADYGEALGELPGLMHARMGAPVFVGSTGAAQLHPTCMSTETPALSVLAGRMPAGEVAACALSATDLPHPDAPPADWRALLPKTASPIRGLIVLSEPHHFDPRPLLAGLDFALPGVPKIGGLASGGRQPNGNALFCDDQRRSQGAVLLALAGDVTATPVVSQGCRPVGRPGYITQATGNRLATVDHIPAKTFVEQQLQGMSQEELAIAELNPLFLGIASDPFRRAPPSAGDFLVRNVLGIDDEAQLVIGDELSVGRSVQLHLRDGAGDLAARLRRAGVATAKAAMMFRCVGRESPDHARFHGVAPSVPMVGGTCSGEIGPVDAVTHLHAYTASCMLLREGSTS